MSERDPVHSAGLALYRRRLLAGTGLCLGGLLVPAVVRAQIDDGRGPPDPTDPAQVLPGPWGPFGGPGGDIGGDDDGSKEGLEESSETAGEIGETLNTIGKGVAGVGGAVAGVGAVTGIGAGVGGIISIIGFVTMGIGTIFTTVSNTLGELADDPPRQNYRQDPACAATPRPQFPTGSASAPQALTAHADAAAAFLGEAASCLAALELWGGARQAGDAQWMIRHRASFVTRFNAMGQRGAAAAGTGPAAIAAIRSSLADAGVTMQMVRDHFQANAPAIRAWGQQQDRQLLDALAGQCAEIGHAARLRGNQGDRIALDRLDSRYQVLLQRMRGLPAYSQVP